MQGITLVCLPPRRSSAQKHRTPLGQGIENAALYRTIRNMRRPIFAAMLMVTPAAMAATLPAHVPPDEASAADALLDLRAVANAGLSFNDFSRYMTEAVVKVDRMQRHGFSQPDLQDALKHFEAAASAWQQSMAEDAATRAEPAYLGKIDAASRDKHTAEMTTELAAARDALSNYRSSP